MKSRITLSLDESTVTYLMEAAKAATGGNVSAYVDRLARDLALDESVRQHAVWYAGHPSYAEDAEAERYAA
jgi:hypothetical protein